MKLASAILALVLVSGVLISSPSVAAESIGDPNFGVTWDRTDAPVRDGQVSRTWMWGPAHSGTMYEPYEDSPGGQRFVQYFEKSRMEINDRDANVTSDWYVTNGLLALEMMTGRVQIGDTSFHHREPAEINIAGDGDDPDGPTYSSFAALRDSPPFPQGHVITEVVDRSGAVRQASHFSSYGVTAETHVSETNHVVASVFWEFMNSVGVVHTGSAQRTDRLFSSPFYATGLPVTEAYWTHIRVGGERMTVLVQAFERRVLTYTPGNPVGWQVEAGNVGLHYYSWRYEHAVNCPVDMRIQDPVPEWSSPRAAILSAVQYHGRNIHRTTLGEHAEDFRGLYHLQNSPVGCYNPDTEHFQDWANWLVGWWYGYVSIDYPAVAHHTRAQIHHAIYEPESLISRRMHNLELGLDPHFSTTGPEVYWDQLLSGYGLMAMDPISYSAFRTSFLTEVDNYRVTTLGTDISFREHLAKSGFIEGWFGISPGDY